LLMVGSDLLMVGSDLLVVGSDLLVFLCCFPVVIYDLSMFLCD